MGISAAEFQRRQSQLLEACSDLDLDALVIVANGSCFGLSGRSQGYMAFFCGWNSFDSPSALILQNGQSPRLVVVHRRMMMMALETLSNISVDWIDQDAFGLGIKRAVTEGRFSPRRLGICGWEDVIAKSWKSVETELSDIKLVDITDRAVALRAIKSAAQLQMHREAARLCDEMFGLLSKLSVLGRFGYQIKADLECFAKQQGAEFVQHWMSIGNPPDYPRYYHPENRQLVQQGDTVVYGMQIILDGVWGHAVRCYSVGSASDRHQKIQSAVLAFQRKFIEMMQAGAEMSEVVRAGFKLRQPVYEIIGPGKIDMLRLGHGIGYSYTEPGISEIFPRSYYDTEQELVRSAPGRFEPGMIFEIHPLFFYSDGAAAVGDMIVIDSGVPAFMTQYPRSIIELEA
jgi:Xaa-Pro aminopeptidase